MQDRVSAAAAERLRPGGSAPAARVAPRIDVFERHARGRRFFHRLEKGTLEQARTLFEEAVGADPSYAPALAGLAAVHAMRFPVPDRPRASSNAPRAMRAAPSPPIRTSPSRASGSATRCRGSGGTRRRSRRSSGRWSSTRTASSRRISAASAPRMPRPARGGPAALSAGRRDRSSPRAIAWLALGWTHLDLGHRAEARWCLEKGLALEGETAIGPTSGVARLSRGVPAAQRRARRRPGGVPPRASTRSSVRTTCTATRSGASSLCALGRIALEQGDQAAAHAAFTQAVAHLRGRPRGARRRAPARPGSRGPGAAWTATSRSLGRRSTCSRDARGTTFRSCGSAPTT